MPSLIFDATKCLGCGICTTVCNFIILDKKGKGNVPKKREPDICIACGHCVAVCPNQAITHSLLNMDNFKEVTNTLTADDIEMFLSSKRSLRNFLDKPIEKEIMERIIEVACQAPSDLNSQNRKFIVLNDKEKIDTLEAYIVEGFRQYVAGALKQGMPESSLEIIISNDIIENFEKGKKPVFKGAPSVIFIAGPVPEKELFAGYSCVVAQTYLVLMAHSLGLGSCVIGRALYDVQKLGEFLEVPAGHKIYSAITLGYPKVKYKRTVDRRKANISWK